MARDYPALTSALNKTGRPIVYSCSWPAYMPQHCEGAENCFGALQESCNLWRNYNDIMDSWQSVSTIINYWARNSSDAMTRAAGPGHWNDPDELMVGNNGLSVSEEQTQFAIWAITASPLIMSNDLRNIRNSSREILLNREVIAVNQDPLGKQGFVLSGKQRWGNTRVWVRELQGGHAAVVLENSNAFANSNDIVLDLSLIPWLPKSAKVAARDLFAHKDIGIISGQHTFQVPVSSVIMLRLSPVPEAVNTVVV
eukprot:gnl/TRDRNA2_/TRDRNA2_148137_c0_seq1.p2 gnl/TRDRNA2_/TRDRNA2_148137_c0~~gnl/TRDRNA2_/TRDRNA2_148137_c0_seq1.p2  ORF type:complete len:295 (-),score=49.53 gnl/TRDRNA2_/TRDRNA2_148137_c0_seq1:127-888(-)